MAPRSVSMSKSLLEPLPEVLASGRKQFERIMEGREGRQSCPEQRHGAATTSIRNEGIAGEEPWSIRLIYGDNPQADDEHQPSLRGKTALICNAQPFSAEADYRIKVTLPSIEIGQKPIVIEQLAYPDTWSDDTASGLFAISPLRTLMRELLANTGPPFMCTCSKD